MAGAVARLLPRVVVGASIAGTRLPVARDGTKAGRRGPIVPSFDQLLRVFDVGQEQALGEIVAC